MFKYVLIGLIGCRCVAVEAVELRTWMVNGVEREALVAVPKQAKTVASPLIFVFHGHGGSMQNVARSHALERRWPEAMVVYPQGLKTPGKLTDPEGKRSGWQQDIPDQGGRDLAFFDAIFASLKEEYAVNEKQVFVTGHSNGGGFTYLLWAARGEQLAAVAPSASTGAKYRFLLKPKPALLIAGEGDDLVPFAGQSRMMSFVRGLNQCDEEGVAWDEHAGCTIYPSSGGNPVVTAVHGGGHAFPREAPDVMVSFFKQVAAFSGKRVD
jgi:polyhydroxybutyrate depolymerase